MVRPGLPLWAVPGPCARERNCSQGLESPGVGTEILPTRPLGWASLSLGRASFRVPWPIN